MKRTRFALGLLATLTGAVMAQEGAVPSGIPHLDHVFVIMMENHGYTEILNNPNAPFISKYARKANLAANYFAVAHPSLTNYREIVGGSNFGIHRDNDPDWHNGNCATNLSTGIPNTDNPPRPAICPISGSGADAATPVLDCSNEVTGPPCDLNLDGKTSYKAATDTLGITIAEQLVAAGKTWTTYQENLPMTGPDPVDYSDGNFTNNTDFSQINPQLTPPLTTGDIVQLYASKHNPFVYFQDVQPGTNPLLSYSQVGGFDGGHGLWSDLASGKVPNFSYIVPNPCNDQHGRGNGTAAGRGSSSLQSAAQWLIKGGEQERQGGCAQAGRFTAHRHVAPGLPRRKWTADAARVGAQLSDHRQRFDPGDESAEGRVSRLGHSLCRHPGLCPALSGGMVEQDCASRGAPPRGTALSRSLRACGRASVGSSSRAFSAAAYAFGLTSLGSPP